MNFRDICVISQLKRHERKSVLRQKDVSSKVLRPSYIIIAPLANTPLPLTF